MPVFKLAALSDMALAVALPVVHTRRQSHASQINSMDDVRALLHTRRVRQYPPYVLSVLTTYVRSRGGTAQKRGRAELEAQLSVLEAEFPEFAAEFRAACKRVGLTLKRDTAPDELPRRSTCPCSFHERQTQRLELQGILSAFPPPPYAAADPDPEAARMLVNLIAGEAGISPAVYAAGRDAEDALASLSPTIETR